MTERISVDEYRRQAGLPPRGKAETVLSYRRDDALHIDGLRVPTSGTAKLHHELGRRPSTEMNKTEARFEREVLIPAKARGEIAWYAFNAVKLRIALDRCWLTQEVKG